MFKQFSELVAKKDFIIKLAKGRPCVVKTGDCFYVTNPQHLQESTGFVRVDRKSRATINSGYDLTTGQIKILFGDDYVY